MGEGPGAQTGKPGKVEEVMTALTVLFFLMGVCVGGLVVAAYNLGRLREIRTELENLERKAKQ